MEGKLSDLDQQLLLEVVLLHPAAALVPSLLLAHSDLFVLQQLPLQLVQLFVDLLDLVQELEVRPIYR